MDFYKGGNLRKGGGEGGGVSSHVERQKKYLAKLNGSIGENQYKERVETSQIEKVRKSRFDKRDKDRARQKR